MLARTYHNPQIKEENQSKLQQLLQLWASNNIYDQDTINALRNEMMGGQSANSFAGPPKELSALSAESVPGRRLNFFCKHLSAIRHYAHHFRVVCVFTMSTSPSVNLSFLILSTRHNNANSLCTSKTGLQQQTINHNLAQWQPDRQSSLPSFGDQEHLDKHAVPGQTMQSPVFAGSMPIPASVQSAGQQSAPHLLPGQTANNSEKAPPYPLFPPGLIPGMVRKMQIGSGVPYSPMSPLDIPTIIPPSTVSQSEILERVSKFFKEIGEVNPSEGPLKSDAGDDDEYEGEYEREPPVRKGGACIPPPPNLQVDPETGTYPDGSVERKPGFNSSGRLGLGATANPNEISQYDDVYTSYRKQRSTNYHSSMSARASTR